MSLDPDTLYEECIVCEGDGELFEAECSTCQGEGYLPHGCEQDRATALLAEEDQLKADLYRDAQIAAYHRDCLIEQGFSEHIAESMAQARYELWVGADWHDDE